MRQWPDNICGGPIRYHEAHNSLGFILCDADHGIPVLGSVSPTDPPTLRCGNQHVRIVNYPGQTEEVARRLVECWNAFVGYQTDEIASTAERLLK